MPSETVDLGYVRGDTGPQGPTGPTGPQGDPATVPTTDLENFQGYIGFDEAESSTATGNEFAPLSQLKAMFDSIKSSIAEKLSKSEADDTYAAKEHTHQVATNSSAGFMPMLNGNASQYLCGDGSWAIPTNTNYTQGNGIQIADGVISVKPKGITKDMIADMPVPVSQGGTGATTADAARKVLKAPVVAGNAEDASIYCDYNYDQCVMTQVSGPGDKYMTVAAYDYFGLYHNTTQSWLWQLWPYNPTKGLLQAGRGNISSLSRDTLYNLAPGAYLVANNATNGPESWSYGNLLLSYSAGNRIVGLLAYDNGHVYTTYGASASEKFLWTRIDVSANVSLLWSGSSSGSVTLADSVANYRAIVTSIGGTDGVIEGSTLVWSPNGKTFDATSTFVVKEQTNQPWRSLRMRFTASGTRLSCSENTHYGTSGIVATGVVRLLNVVGIR